MRDRKDKQIRAFLNSCRHRGEKVCRYDQGNSLVFTCPFHAWTYDTKGKLVGAGFQNSPEAYTDTLNKAEWGLVEVAQLCNFYGLIWATWDRKAPVLPGLHGSLRREPAPLPAVERRRRQRPGDVHPVPAASPADQLEGSRVHLRYGPDPYGHDPPICRGSGPS